MAPEKKNKRATASKKSATNSAEKSAGKNRPKRGRGKSNSPTPTPHPTPTPSHPDKDRCLALVESVQGLTLMEVILGFWSMMCLRMNSSRDKNRHIYMYHLKSSLQVIQSVVQSYDTLIKSVVSKHHQKYYWKLSTVPLYLPTIYLSTHPRSLWGAPHTLLGDAPRIWPRDAPRIWLFDFGTRPIRIWDASQIVDR